MLTGHYQNAYVTNNAQWAMDQMSKRYALGNWATFEVELQLQTRHGEQLQKTRVGCAWGGWLQYEVIEPISGFIDPFLPYLPQDKSDKSLRFHHISLRRESMEEIDAEIRRIGAPIVCSGGIPDLQFTYLDTREVLGHYLEFVHATEAGWAMVGWPEDRPSV